MRFESCSMTLNCFLGSRAGLLFDRKWRSQLGFLRTLPLLLFFFGIAFNLSASLAVNGLDLTTKPACRGAMYICLVFYVGVKVCVQLFLIERAHVVRANSKRRLHDFFWLTGVFVVTVGFGTIAVFAFLGPVAEVDPLDGQCRIGLPRKSTMVLMAYDIFINLAMTAVFLALLRPMFRMRNPTSATAILTPMSSLKPLRPALAIRYPYSGISGGKSTSSSTTSSTEPLRPGPTTPQVAYPAAGNLEALVYKSLLGAILMMAATVINLALLFNYHGEEHSWLCFTCCLVDGTYHLTGTLSIRQVRHSLSNLPVTWSVAVIHFLTDAARSSDGNLRDSSCPVSCRRCYVRRR